MRKIGEIVADIAFKDLRHGHPETAGVERLLSGVVARHARDCDRLIPPLRSTEAPARNCTTAFMVPKILSPDLKGKKEGTRQGTLQSNPSLELHGVPSVTTEKCRTTSRAGKISGSTLPAPAAAH